MGVWRRTRPHERGEKRRRRARNVVEWRMRASLVAIVGCVFLATAFPARADGGGEREQLMLQLTQEYDALSTSDCTSACRALASMERAANRLCVLDTGKVCDDARTKLEDARKRVRAACPMCVVDSPKGSTTPMDAGDLGAAGLAALGLLLVRRRRR